MENNRYKLSAFYGSAIVTLVFLASFFLWQNQFEKAETDQKLEDIQQQLEEIKVPLEKIAFPDYYAATKELKQQIIVSDLQSSVDKDGSIKGKISKYVQLEGKISKGYLFAEAYVDAGKPLTRFDSIYVNLIDFGGHLLRSKSLSVPQTPSGNTLILYSLNNIPYLKTIPYDENKIGLTSDWTRILNDNRSHEIHTFLSSNRAGGKILNITISYECSKETPDCKFSIR